jgi:uncharacterized protein (TIGR02996 family)
MRTAAAIFEAILADPEDDALRLEYADAIAASDPARAHYIRWHIAYDHWQIRGRYPAWATLEYRGAPTDAHELEKEWARQVIPFCLGQPGWRYHRGFIVGISTTAAMFLTHGSEILRLAPLRIIVMAGEAGEPARLPLDALAASPLIDRFDDITLSNGEITIEDLETFARSPYLDRLCTLRFEHQPELLQGRVWEIFASTRSMRKLLEIGCHAVDYPGEWADYTVDTPDRLTYYAMTRRGHELEAQHGYIPWLHLENRDYTDTRIGRYVAAGRLPRFPAGSPPYKTKSNTRWMPTAMPPTTSTRTVAECFAAILADPEDDAVRLEYADALGPTDLERADYVRVELASEYRIRHGHYPSWAFPPVEPELLPSPAETARVERQWAHEILPFCASPPELQYHRGFIIRIATTAATLLAHGETILGLAPLRFISVVADSAEEMRLPIRELMESPVLNQLHGLTMSADVTLDELELIARSPNLARLRYLAIISSSRLLPGEAMDVLTSTPSMRRLLEVRAPIAGWELTTSYGDGNPSKRDSQHIRALEAQHGYIPWLHESSSSSYRQREIDLDRRVAGGHAPLYPPGTPMTEQMYSAMPRRVR